MEVSRVEWPRQDVLGASRHAYQNYLWYMNIIASSLQALYMRCVFVEDTS